MSCWPLAAGGTPPVVMTIVFAGAPLVNAVVGLIKSPPKDGWGSIPWPFYLGFVLAIAGAALVTMYKPAPAPADCRRSAARTACRRTG